MYYPYLRGKQFELILLREQSALLKNNQFHPIIEPVKRNISSLRRTIVQLIKAGVEFTLVINPQCGDLITDNDIIYDLARQVRLDDVAGCTLGYIISPGSDIKGIIDDINSTKYNYSIIHYGYIGGERAYENCENQNNISQHIFIDGFNGVKYRSFFDNSNKQRILIRDGFRIRKNARYPETEHFSDLHLTFQTEN